MGEDEKIARLEANVENLTVQMEDVKSEVKDIRRLTIAVEKIAVQTENTAQKVGTIDKRLETVENKPLDDVQYYRRLIVGSICTALIGTLLGYLIANLPL